MAENVKRVVIETMKEENGKKRGKTIWLYIEYKNLQRKSHKKMEDEFFCKLLFQEGTIMREPQEGTTGHSVGKSTTRNSRQKSKTNPG